MLYQLTEETDVESIAAPVRRGIRGADPPDVGPRDYQPLGVALRTPDGTLLGGVYGATIWGWLMVDGLWVALQSWAEGRNLPAALSSPVAVPSPRETTDIPVPEPST